MTLKTTFSLALIGALAASGLLTAGAAPAQAEALTPLLRNGATYKLQGRLGSHDANCVEANLVGTPYSYSGPETAVSTSTAATFSLVEPNSGRVAATYASNGSLTAGSEKVWDGSIKGSIAFGGNATVDGKTADCSGYGEISASYERTIRAERDGTFTINAQAGPYGFSRLEVEVVDVAANGEPAFDSQSKVLDKADVERKDATGRPIPFTASVSVRVRAGQFVIFGGVMTVHAFNLWSYSETEGGPRVYRFQNYPQSGGGSVTYGLKLDPARGQQLALSSAKDAKVVTLPGNLGCSSKVFAFKPKRVSKFRSATVFANGKMVKKFTRVKAVNRVRLNKAKATRVKIVFKYKTGKPRTVVVAKSYAGCRR